MPENDIALELARLHILQGADFVRQLKMLAQYNIFKKMETKGMYSQQKVAIEKNSSKNPAIGILVSTYSIHKVDVIRQISLQTLLQVDKFSCDSNIV